MIVTEEREREGENSLRNMYEKNCSSNSTCEKNSIGGNSLNILNIEKGKFKKKVRAIKDEKNWKKSSILRKREIKRNQIDTLNVNLGNKYASSCT